MASFDPHAQGAKIVSGFNPEMEGATISEENNNVQQSQQSPLNMIQGMLEQPTWEDVKNRTKGLAQGAENVGIGYANLLPGVNISKANWAGNSPEAQKGETLADIGSFFLPGGAFKALHYIPHIGNALKAAIPLMKERSVLNALGKVGKSTTEGAISNAVLADKDNQKEAGLIGGGLGAGTNIIAQLSNIKNPIINALVRSLIGGGIGATVGGLTGNNPFNTATIGAGLGIASPSLARGIGITGNPAGMETLEHLNPRQVEPSVLAANRLNTPITPAEASGNPFVGGIEGKYGRTGEAAALKTDIGQERIGKQNAAINDLLDTIYDKSTPQATKASKQKIEDLYTKAYQWNLKPDLLQQFKNDPVIDAAFNRVKSDPAYQRKLMDVPENNFAYLNQVKRALSDMEGAALKAGEKDRAAEFKEARNNLVSTMDKSVPEYGQAREEAQKSIIRSNIQKAMRKKEMKGSSFYNTLLKNDDEFNKLHESLKNVPEAQDKLKDMRLAWKNLIDIEKPKNTAFRAETGLSQSRNWASQLIDMWNDMTGAKRNMAALKFIHSPDWDKSFAKIAEIKDKNARKEAMANLIAKLTTASQGTASQGS